MELTYTGEWAVSTRTSRAGTEYTDHELDIADYSAHITVRDGTATRWAVHVDGTGTILSSPNYHHFVSGDAWQPRTDIGALRMLCMNAIVEHHRETHQP